VGKVVESRGLAWDRASAWMVACCVAAAVTGCVGGNASVDDAPDESAAIGPDADGDGIPARIDGALDLVLRRRHLSLKEHAAWQIIHGALAFRRDFPVLLDGEREVSALEHVLRGGAMRGWEFEPGDVLDPATGHRGLRAVLAPGSKSGQGHADQWLGYLAECGLEADDEIRVGDTTYHISDIVAQAEGDVPRNVDREYSWTLMGLTSYRPTDHEWVASDGKQWSIEDLVRIECEHDLATSACGGTHRMYGLTMAFNRHLAQGRPVEGAWATASDRIAESARRAREFQNPDGSFSSHYFERPGMAADITQTLGSSGHVFEFLMMAMTDEEVRHPKMEQAALRICGILERTRDLPLECGALYHAAHGLVLYRTRRFGAPDFSHPIASVPDGKG